MRQVYVVKQPGQTIIGRKQLYWSKASAIKKAKKIGAIVYLNNEPVFQV